MRRRIVVSIVLIVVALVIKTFSLFPDAVERYYSNGIYPVISRAQRILFGWIPLSVGDIFYGVVVIILLRTVWRTIRRIRRREAGRLFWSGVLARLVSVSLWVYVFFNILWGLNYNRRGMAYHLQLSTELFSSSDLANVMQVLVTRLNTLDSAALQHRSDLAHKRYLFSGAVVAYGQLSSMDNRFSYSSPSVKPSLFSYLGNYLGYTGYYNPFSGEAQVNTTVPLVVQPFTTCHEIGHQLGYAKEDEANFAGYLSARSSPDPAFRYSVYFDLYNYCRFFLYADDSVLLKKMDSQLHPLVRRDYKEVRNFYLAHENPVEGVIDRLYSQYLKANEQPLGKVTYSRVIVWLISYSRKYGINSL